MRFQSFLIAILFIVPALVAGKWTTFCTQQECPSIIMDIACSSESSCTIAGGYSDTMFGMYRSTDNFKTFTLGTFDTNPIMLMAVDYSGGVTVSAGLGMPLLNISSVVYSTDETNYYKSNINKFMVSQDIKRIGNSNNFGLAGTVDLMSNESGVYISTSGPKTFHVAKWPQALSNYTSARYGSFPDTGVMFVTGGEWPSDGETQVLKDISDRCLRISKNLCVPASKDVSDEYITKFNSRKLKRNANDGYKAVITKSVDNGKSWDVLFNKEADFYFNDISCIDSNRCIAVGEGDANAYVYLTENGKDFRLIFDVKSLFPKSRLFSILRAVYASPTDMWVFATYEDNGNISSVPLVSTDGGKTFSKTDGELADVVIITGAFFDPSYKYAYITGLTQQSDSVIVKYTPN